MIYFMALCKDMPKSIRTALIKIDDKKVNYILTQYNEIPDVDLTGQLSNTRSVFD
jgi:hypothetical protein